jgi:hypothetical protein
MARFSTGRRSPQHGTRTPGKRHMARGRGSFGSRAGGREFTGLLDTLTVQPRWASWLGGLLRADYGGPLFRCKNDSGNEQDIYPGADGYANRATLRQHCGSGNGIVNRVYNQVDGTAYPHISADSDAEAPLVYEAGEPVLGESGYLAAHFDGASDISTDNFGSNFLYRSDTLGLLGDVDVTLAGDAYGTPNALSFQGFGFIGEYPSNAHADGCMSVVGYLTYPVAPGTVLALEVDYGASALAAFAYGDQPSTGEFSGWWQASRPMGSGPDGIVARLSGEAFPMGTVIQPATVLNMRAGRFAWCACPWGAAGVTPAPLIGNASNFFCWNAVLGTEDQDAFDAWQALVHA